MGDPKNTITSSELSMLLLGSNSELPITGSTGATKEWTEVGGKSRSTKSSLQSWERSGRGLNTVEASQLLKEQAHGLKPKTKASISTSRHRKTEMRGGKAGVVRDYHLLLNDLPTKSDLFPNNQPNWNKTKDVSCTNNIAADSGYELLNSSNVDMKSVKSLLGKRPHRESSDSSSSTANNSHDDDDDDDDDETATSSSEYSREKDQREDDASSDEVDARRNRARLKSFQRRGDTFSNKSQVGLDLEANDYSMKSQVSSNSDGSDQSCYSSDSADFTSDSDSSSSNSSSEEKATSNLTAIQQSMKPIFVPKSQRISAAQQRLKEKGKA